MQHVLCGADEQKAVELVKRLLRNYEVSIETKPAGVCSGSGEGTGSNGDGSSKPKVAAFNETSVDIGKTLSIPRPLIGGSRVVRNVLTYFTGNTLRDTAFGAYPTEFNWMGIARLYLSPLNLGFENLQRLNLGAYHVDWISVRVLGITFSSDAKCLIETSIVGETDDEGPSAVSAIGNKVVYGALDQKDKFVSLDGALYTIGYLSAQDLATTRFGDNVNGMQSYVENMGQSFIKSIEKSANGTNTFYGIGFITQHATSPVGGTSESYQYEGPYAIQARESSTQEISKSSSIVIEHPEAYALTLSTTSQYDPATIDNGKTDAANTYQYSKTTGLPYTGASTVGFQSEQLQSVDGGALESVSVQNAVTPIYGMVQIDVPEDLIQTVYHKASGNGITALTKMGVDDQQLYGVSVQREESVLNANFVISIEYGITAE